MSYEFSMHVDGVLHSAFTDSGEGARAMAEALARDWPHASVSYEDDDTCMPGYVSWFQVHAP